MLCNVCGTENQQNSRFCGNCGNNLEGKIQCPGCKEWVSQEFNFCPHCSSSLKPKVKDTNKRVVNKVDRSNLFTILTNSIVVVLCLGLFLILFGGVVSYTTPAGVSRQITLSDNIVEFIDASIKGFQDFDMGDFEDAVGEYESESDVYHKANFISLYMLDEIEDVFMIQRLVVYVNTLILIAMAILPIVLIGFTIKDFIEMRKQNRYKKFFLVTLLLGLVMLLTIPLMGFEIGAAIIFYIIFSSLGLLSSYIIELLNKERSFNGKKFAFKLATTLSLAVLILLSTSSILDIRNERTDEVGDSANYGDFAFIINRLDEDHNTGYFMNMEDSLLAMSLTSDEFTSENEWICIVALLIPLSLIPALILLIISLITETAKGLGLRLKKCHTTALAWIAFGLEAFALLVTIVVILVSNNVASEQNLGFYYTISAGIICLTLFTLVFAIYRNISRRLINE